MYFDQGCFCNAIDKQKFPKSYEDRLAVGMQSKWQLVYKTPVSHLLSMDDECPPGA